MRTLLLVYLLIYAPFGLNDLTQPDQYDLETFQTILQHVWYFNDTRFSIHWNVFKGCNWQQVVTGLGNGLAPKRQAIFWSNDGLIYWRIYVLLDLNKLFQCPHIPDTHHPHPHPVSPSALKNDKWCKYIYIYILRFPKKKSHVTFLHVFRI